MNQQIKDGKPTGRLNARNQMEVSLYVQDGDRKIPIGSRWVDITDEQRKLIEGQRVSVASYGVSNEVLSQVASLEVKVGQQGNPMFLKTEACIAHANVPDRNGNVLSSEALKAYVERDAVVDAPAKEPIGKVFLVEDQPADAASVAGTYPRFADGHNCKLAINDKGQVVADRNTVIPDAFGHPNNGKVELTDDTIMTHEGAVQTAEFKGQVHLIGMPCGTSDTRVQECIAAHEQRIITRDQAATKPAQREHSGFNVNYYSVHIANPKRPERPPYTFEVEDLIQALGMTFHEGTVLKSLVRSCVEREFGIGKVGGDTIRDAEKMVHSSTETLRIRKLQQEKKHDEQDQAR